MMLDIVWRQLLCIFLVVTVFALVFAIDKSEVDNTFDDYDYDVDRRSSITSLSLSSSSSSAADAGMARRWRRRPTWRWCYVCSGKTPDRQCELFPQHVTFGPSKVNCTKNYCTAYVRYKPKDYVLRQERDGKTGAETLTPDDYEVTSVARECENADRGNECHVDSDELGATCYSTCTTHYCNNETPRPTWRDLLRRRISRPPQPDVDDSPSIEPIDVDDQHSQLPSDTQNQPKPGPDRVKDISLYQPANWNDVVGGGGGNYKLPSDFNTTAYITSKSAADNFTLSSSTSCRICNYRLVVVFTLLSISSYITPAHAFIN